MSPHGVIAVPHDRDHRSQIPSASTGCVSPLNRNRSRRFAGTGRCHWIPDQRRTRIGSRNDDRGRSRGDTVASERRRSDIRSANRSSRPDRPALPMACRFPAGRRAVAGARTCQGADARWHRLRDRRRAAALVADSDGDRRALRRQGRPDHRRLGSPDQRAGRGVAQWHVHPGFRARRLPPPRTAAQRLTRPAGTVGRGRGRATGQRTPFPRGRDGRIRDRSARRHGLARRTDALAWLAFRRGLRHPRRSSSRGPAARARCGALRGCAGACRHAVGRADGGAVRGDVQADAPRLLGPQRPLLGDPGAGRIHRHQARLRASVRRLPRDLRRRTRSRREPAHRRARRALGGRTDRDQALRRDGCDPLAARCPVRRP